MINPPTDKGDERGACLPKSRWRILLTLATALPKMEFNLYAMGYQVKDLHQVNDKLGNP
jgi:hypothetical protein